MTMVVVRDRKKTDKRTKKEENRTKEEESLWNQTRTI